MQDLTIGLFQFDQVWQDKKANFELIAKQLTTAPKLDVLLLPEMFHTGFSMEMSCADDWQRSKGLDFLKKLSQSHTPAMD
jgi:predicted amidohydrolase